MHLQNVFFGCDIVRRIVRRNRCRVLGDDFPTVYLITYVMDRHTGFGFPRCLDCFVNMVSVHSHAAELGEQCGMKIDHLVFISIDKKIRDDEQEAGEYDESMPNCFMSAIMYASSLNCFFGTTMVGIPRFRARTSA